MEAIAEILLRTPAIGEAVLGRIATVGHSQHETAAAEDGIAHIPAIGSINIKIFGWKLHCYNCVGRKSKARCPMIKDFGPALQNLPRSNKQNEPMEAEYLIFQLINGKVFFD